MRVRRALGAVAAIAVLSMVAVGCQVGVSMWGACSPASSGNPFGTDGEWVLICRDGTWQPVMTVEEYLRLRRGEDVTRRPLPTRPTTTTTTTTTTILSATVDVDNEHSSTDFGISVGNCLPFGSTPFEFAQSFTAGRTGELTRVDLVLRIYDGNPLPADVKIMDAGVSGPGTVLNSTLYSGPESPDSTTLVPIELSSPVAVQAGTKYFIAISAGSTCPGQGAWRVDSLTTSTYSGGEAWLNDPWGSFPQWGDLSFRTWVR